MIELPPDDTQSLDNQNIRNVNAPKGQPVYPYTSPQSSNQSVNTNAAGKRINRYYPVLKPFYVKESSDDTTLVFESRFESGNLRRVV